MFQFTIQITLKHTAVAAAYIPTSGYANMLYVFTCIYYQNLVFDRKNKDNQTSEIT